MSHEVLLLAGSGDPAARARRVAAVEHAADAVPGAVSWSVLQTPTAVAALVQTAPAGGSFAELVGKDVGAEGGGRITVALQRRGLAAATGVSAEHGAEAGHVTVRLGRDVHVATDGVGMVPAFWGVRGDELVLATHLASLVSLGLAADVDEGAVVEYLSWLFPMGERTLLRGARLLGAGARLRWADGRADVQRRPLYVPSADALDDDEAVAAFRRAWAAAIDDAFEGPGRLGIGLSGGLDSRIIAEGAAAAGLAPISFTYGAVPNREAVVAAQVADVLELPHLAVPVADRWLLAGAPATLRRLDGSHSVAEVFEPWFAGLLGTFTDGVVNGLGGGTALGDSRTSGVADRGVIEGRLVARYVKQLGSVAPFLADDLRAGAEEVVRRSLSASLDPWEWAARPDMLTFWEGANGQIRWGNTLATALRRAGLRLEAPLLDARFRTLAARLTPDQRRNGRLFSRILREVFPRTASVPRSKDGTVPGATAHIYWSGDSSYAAQAARLAARHPITGAQKGWWLGTQAALPRLRSRPALAGLAERYDERHSVFPADVWLRTRPVYADRLVALLQADRPAGLISSAAVDAAVAGVRSGSPTAPALVLGKVGSLLSWLTDYRWRAESFTAAQATW